MEDSGPTRGDAELPALSGDAALELAAELSRRAQRGSAAARRLTHMLLPRTPAAGTSDAAAEQLTVGCRTCAVTLHPNLEDPDEAAEQARSFFSRHAECLTFLDLDPIRRALG